MSIINGNWDGVVEGYDANKYKREVDMARYEVKKATMPRNEETGRVVDAQNYFAAKKFCDAREGREINKQWTIVASPSMRAAFDAVMRVTHRNMNNNKER